MKNKLVFLTTFFGITACFFVQAQTPDYAWAVQSTIEGADVTDDLVALDTVNHFVYSAGWFEGGAIDFGSGSLDNIDPNSGSDDIFVAKYTTGGSLVWAKTFGGYGSDALTGLAVDNTGNVFIAGNYDSDTLWFNNGKMVVNPSFTTSIYLAKLDGDGNTQWAKTGTFSGSSYISPAGNSMLAIDRSNNLYLTGSVTGTVSFDSVDSIGSNIGTSMFVVKFDADGNQIWSTQSEPLTTNLNPGAVIPYAVNVDKDGNCLVVGDYTDDSRFGGFAVTGNNDFYSDRFAAKIDKNTGSFIWLTPAGAWQGPDVNYGVSSDNNGNVYLTGSLTIPTEGPSSSAADNEYFIEKLNANGDSSWIVNSYFATAIVNFYITTDGDGNSFIALAVNDTAATFGNITIHIPYPNAFDVAGITAVIVKFDNAGNAVWVRPVDGQGTVPATLPGGIAIDNNDCIYAVGTVIDTAYFGTHMLIGNSSSNSFYLTGFCNGVSGIKDNGAMAMTDISVYPNPAATSVAVNCKVNTTGDYSIVIQNIEGQQVAEEKQLGILTPGDYTNVIDVSKLSNGFYLVGFKTATGVIYRKLVIQK